MRFFKYFEPSRLVWEWTDLSPEHKHKSGDKNVQDGKREQDFPSQMHQLVIAKTRQSPADEEEKPAEEENFDPERNNLQNRYAQ